MEDLSLHILDVAENGIRAGASLIRITIEEDFGEDLLELSVQDNGGGMDPEFLARVLDPFVTTRDTRKVGLGLSLLQQSAQEADGDLTIDSSPERGTTVSVTMVHSHVDRKPLGNLAETLTTLVEGNPEIDFVYRHRRNGREYLFDTREIRTELEEIPLNHPDVVRLIRDNAYAGLAEIGSG